MKSNLDPKNKNATAGSFHYAMKKKKGKGHHPNDTLTQPLNIVRSKTISVYTDKKNGVTY
ncbi:Unknown protein sequence [Pseudomonas amygdali pv. lachrymans]|nr:Unknown protein sequence [Pseudomonas amygdali pv. lachrymans]